MTNAKVIQFPAKEKTPLDEVVAKVASGEYVDLFIVAVTHDGLVKKFEVSTQQ